MEHDLISFADDDGDAISPTTNGIDSRRMTANIRPQTAHRDSFSDLAGMMKAKKPYTSVSPPAPRAPPLMSATNDVRFAARNSSNSTMFSPLAKRFQTRESVAGHLQRQEIASPIDSQPSLPEYHQKLARLDSLTEAISKFEVEDDETCHRPRTPSPSYEEPLPVQGLQPSFRFGPIELPTPTEFLPPTWSAFRSDQEPVVRLTKQVWDKMGQDLDSLRIQNHELKKKLSALEKHNEVLRNDDHDVSMQLGKLRYQNDADKNQKALMGRALAEREMKIKEQQLDIDELTRKLGETEEKLKDLRGVLGELEYLRGIKISTEAAHECALSDLSANKDREVNYANNTIRQLEERLLIVTSERDAASRAQGDSNPHQTRANNLADTLVKREKMMVNLRHELLTERCRAQSLEEELEKLNEKTNQEDIDDLKKKLHDKSRDCDRQRTQLKKVEFQLKHSQDLIMRASNNGELLKGAAHLVKPNEKCKLPKNVIACSECYAQNMPCDNSARCRSCTERDAICRRWRCALKHRLGDCLTAPCSFPHDSQGWLMTQSERPQW